MRHPSPSVRIAEKGDVPAIAGILRELGWFPKVEEKLVARNLELCQADASHTVLVSLDDEDRVAGPPCLRRWKSLRWRKVAAT